MIHINAYKVTGKGGRVYSMMFRYAVISKVFGIEMPKDVEVQILSEDAAVQIKAETHSEKIDRLLFLYGAGVISEETALQLIITNKSDFFDDITAAENAVITDENSNAEDNLSNEQIESILLCSSNTKKYAEMQPISFAEAQELAGLPHISLVDGLAKVTDSDYYKFLIDLGEQFGTVTKDDSIRTEENPQYLLENEEVKKGDVKSQYYPFPLNLKRLLRYSAVYDKPYGKDFIKFAKENSLPIDEKYESRYEEYIKKIKLHFTVKSYNRKRHVCGDKINWFDYAAAADGSITDNLNADHAKEIDLDVFADYTDKELIRKAIDKFRSIIPLDEGTVIEVYHNSEKTLYLVKKSGLESLDNEKFHVMLFDFNKIWGIIQLCSRSRQIKVIDGKITIPDNFMEEIEPTEREYAERIIKEQYLIMKERRKSNRLIRTLSELKSEVKTQRTQQNKQQAVTEQKQKEIAEKKLNRGSSTEG